MTPDFESASGDDWQDGGSFGHIAKLTGMSLHDWRSVAPHIPSWPGRQSLLRQLLRKSGRSGTQLYCFDDCVLQLYEGTIAFSHFSLYTRTTRERIREKNEVVDPSARLAAAERRDICVMLEALVFKSVHIKLEGQLPSYRERTETYEMRLDRLVNAGLLDPRLKQLGQELYETRCEFAHSIKSIDNLNYLGEPLELRWGSRGTMQTRTFQRYFLSDAYRYSEALLAMFRPVQGQQIDGAVFKTELLAALVTVDEQAVT
jgi:hypothetical protein